MTKKQISQREARRLRKRVAELEGQEERRRRTWGQEWFGGVHIVTVNYEDANGHTPTAVRTARKLGHAVIVLGDDTGTLRLMALPLAKA